MSSGLPESTSIQRVKVSSPFVIQPFIATLQHVVATTLILENTPLLVHDALWPSHGNDVLLPDRNRVARAIRRTGVYPKYWLLQNVDHFVAGLVVDEDDETTT